MPNEVYNNEVIKHLYSEASLSENQNFSENLIFENNESEDDFFELLALKEELDNLSLSPSKKTIDNILSYSKKTNFESFV